MKYKILIWISILFVLISSVTATTVLNMTMNTGSQKNPGIYNSTFAEDLSINNYNGVVVGAGYSNITGIFNTGAYNFSGTAQYIRNSVTGLTELNSNKNYTISLWMKRSNDNNRMIFSSSTDASNEVSISIIGGASDYISCRMNDGSDHTAASADNTILENIWYHIVCTKSGTTMKIYIDSEDKTNNTSGSDLSVTGTYLASWNNALYFGGYLDEVLVFNYALNNTEIINLYNSYTPIPPIPPNPYISFYNQTPLNNTNINTNTLLNFITYNFNTTSQCTLYVNGINKYVTGNLSNGLNNITYFTSYGNEGYNLLNISCMATYNTSLVRSEQKYIFQDVLVPTFNYIKYNQSGLKDLNQSNINNNFYYYINVSDNNLYKFNMNVSSWGRTGINYTVSKTIIGNKTYLYNVYSTIATYTYGWTKYFLEVLDAHTLIKLTSSQNKYIREEPYTVTIDNENYTGIDIGEKVKIYSSSKDMNLIEVKEETEYSKSFNIKLNKNKTEIKTYVQGNKIDFINSDYPGHFVIDNLIWVDHLPKDANTIIKKVKQIDKNKYELTLSSKDGKPRDNFAFNSFGVINKINTTITGFIDNIDKSDNIIRETFVNGLNTTTIYFALTPHDNYFYINLDKNAILTNSRLSLYNPYPLDPVPNVNISLGTSTILKLTASDYYTLNDFSNIIQPYLKTCSCVGCVSYGNVCRIKIRINQPSDIFLNPAVVIVSNPLFTYNINWSYNMNVTPVNVARNDSHTFKFNLTVNSSEILITSIKLNDSNTFYTVPITVYGGYTDVSYTIPANRPIGIYKYNWLVNYTQLHDSAKKTFKTTSSLYSIYNVSFNPCTGTTSSIQFNIFNEEKPTQKLNATLEMEVKYWQLNPDNYQSYHVLAENNNTYRFCFSPYNTTFYGDIYAQYTTVNGFTHRYYLFNQSFNASTNLNITMYNFNDTTGISNLQMIARHKINYTYFPNVVAKLQRLYLSEGLYRTVQMDRSGDFGNLFFNIKEENTDYRILFFDERNNLLKQTEPMKFICDSGKCELIQLLSSYTGEVTSNELIITRYYNNDTMILYVNWTDPQGNNNKVESRVTKMTVTGENIICNTFQTGASGTVQCNLTGYSGDVLSQVLTSNSPYVPIDTAWIHLTGGLLSLYIPPVEAVFWTLAIMITVIGFGLWSPVASIFSMLAGLFFIFFLGIFTPLTVTFLTISVIIGVAIGLKVKT